MVISFGLVRYTSLFFHSFPSPRLCLSLPFLPFLHSTFFSFSPLYIVTRKHLNFLIQTQPSFMNVHGCCLLCVSRSEKTDKFRFVPWENCGVCWSVGRSDQTDQVDKHKIHLVDLEKNNNSSRPNKHNSTTRAHAGNNRIGPCYSIAQKMKEILRRRRRLNWKKGIQGPLLLQRLKIGPPWLAFGFFCMGGSRRQNEKEGGVLYCREEGEEEKERRRSPK